MVDIGHLLARHLQVEPLHTLDFDEALEPFYLDACGFTPTRAGLIQL